MDRLLTKYFNLRRRVSRRSEDVRTNDDDVALILTVTINEEEEEECLVGNRLDISEEISIIIERSRINSITA